MRRILLSLLVTLGIAAPVHAKTSAADDRMTALGEEFISHWLARSPQTATRLGVHNHDSELRPVTQATIAEDIAWLKSFRPKLESLPRTQLSFERAMDRDVLMSRIDRELLNLQVVKPYERNPNSYLDLIAGSVQSLLQRNFASPCDRIRSAAARLSHVPEVLRAAKLNLKNPPRIYTEVAISQYTGTLRFYREVIPTLTLGCRDARAQGDLAQADSAAVKAVESFLVFLKEDLLPRSNGDFALGKETYQRKLATDEMETTPVDTLLRQAWTELERHRSRMAVVAERIAPGAGVKAALDSLERSHPAENELVPYVSAQLDHIRSFLSKRDLITMPERENLIVRETPLFARSLSFASMDSPGVWEQKANEAYYNVTPVDPSWTEEQKRNHLGFFNRWSSEIVSIHEGIPGHYYQFLALKQGPSRIRQVLGSGSNTEGWAHYCEQMMVEQGYDSNDPRYELAQLEMAVQRLGRFIVGISLHTQGMSYDQAVKLFEEQCYMAPVNAEREARRGTSDPTYLVYTLGKWRLLALREEVRARMGESFSLKTFHDAVLRQGSSPLPIVRLGVLHDLFGDTTAVRP